jgi:hypothetical protein
VPNFQNATTQTSVNAWRNLKTTSGLVKSVKIAISL